MEEQTNKTKLIKNYDYEDLQTLRTVYIASPLSNEEINNLKYLSTNNKIELNFQNYENIEQILDKLLTIPQNIKITIKVEDKELFNKSNIYKNSSKYSNLNINIEEPTNSKTVNLQTYKYYEEILYLFIKPAIERNYSPFEKYIYAYNITKHFKEYKENDQNESNSRNLYDILVNEYMVCVGYSRMFIDLLSKLGISSMDKSATVTTNKANENIVDKEEIMDTGDHCRVYVHIVDPKYNIDGFYISDPTWDSDSQNDYYNFLAVTNQEMNYSHRGIFQSIQDMLFDSNDKEDFYNRLERAIDRKMQENLNTIKKFDKQPNSRTIDLKRELILVYIDIINKLLNVIEKLDKKEYQRICNKFHIATSKSDPQIEKFLDQIPKIFEYLCNYITSKVNKPISGETIIDAAMVINKDIFNLTEQQATEFRNHLIEINKERQLLAFPQITVENHRTGEITYENTQNKFDVDINSNVQHQK